MLALIQSSVYFAIYVINLVYNFEVEFFNGTKTKVGEIFIAACIFMAIVALIMNLLGIKVKGDDKDD